MTVMGYPISKVLRPRTHIIEVFVIGSWTIILIVYIMGLFRIPFHIYVIPVFTLFLFASGVLLIRQNIQMINWIQPVPQFLLPLTFIAIISRILQVQSLSVPNWLDGIAHYAITNNILIKGFVAPDRLYHAGFHSLTSFLSILLPAFSLSEILLMLGQWLSFLAGLSFFLLVRKIDREGSIALISLVFLWFFAPFPSYLVSWSRYPLLAGLAFFPLGYLAIQEWLQGDRLIQFLLVGLAGTVLFLTHYYVFIIWAACLLVQSVGSTQLKPRLWQWLVLISIMLFLASWRIPSLVKYLAAAISQSDRNLLDPQEVIPVFKLLFKNGGWILWVLIPAGVQNLFSEKRKQVGKVLLILVFAAGFELLQNSLSTTRPPGIQNTIIFATFPLVYTASIGLQSIVRALAKNRMFGFWRSRRLTAATLLIVLVSAYNISFRLINPGTVLLDAADQAAFRWLQSHTHESDVVAIQASVWDAKSQSCDGGSWLPYLANRQTVLMESAFDPAATPARYIYRGSCEDPLYPYENRLSAMPIIYQNSRVTILRIVK